jgi:predicted membrane protein
MPWHRITYSWKSFNPYILDESQFNYVVEIISDKHNLDKQKDLMELVGSEIYPSISKLVISFITRAVLVFVALFLNEYYELDFFTGVFIIVSSILFIWSAATLLLYLLYDFWEVRKQKKFCQSIIVDVKNAQSQFESLPPRIKRRSGINDSYYIFRQLQINRLNNR